MFTDVSFSAPSVAFPRCVVAVSPHPPALPVLRAPSPRRSLCAPALSAEDSSSSQFFASSIATVAPNMHHTAIVASNHNLSISHDVQLSSAHARLSCDSPSVHLPSMLPVDVGLRTPDGQIWSMPATEVSRIVQDNRRYRRREEQHSWSCDRHREQSPLLSTPFAYNFDSLFVSSAESVNPLYLFTDDFINLRYHLSCHGIAYIDLSFSECQSALLRHLFSGSCAFSLYEPCHDHKGCHTLWNMFECATDMVQCSVDSAVRHCNTSQLVVASQFVGLDAMEGCSHRKRTLKHNLLDYKHSLSARTAASSTTNSGSGHVRSNDNPFNTLEKMPVLQLKHHPRCRQPRPL